MLGNCSIILYCFLIILHLYSVKDKAPKSVIFYAKIILFKPDNLYIVFEVMHKIR